MSTTNLVLKHLPRYPAHISGSNGIQVTVSGGIDLVVSPDYGTLVPVPGVTNPSMTYFMAWDRSINYYQSISFQDFADNLAGQVLAGTLVALRDVTFDADEGVYFSDFETAHAYSLSPYVRSISGAADLTAFKTLLALENVDNTADLDKPISTATQTALDAKVSAASPTLTGDPKAPTPAAGDSDTSIATTAFVQGAIPDFVQGLTLSNNVSDANNDIDIAAGTAKAGAKAVINSASFTKRLDAVWASGTGNGGLDTGSKAVSSTYHLHAIINDTTGAFDALFSLSATAPTVPSGWSRVKRIGAVLTDGSGNIRAFIQTVHGSRRKYLWSSGAISDVNAANPGTSAVTRTLTVPTGISVEAIIGVAGGTNSGVTSANQPRGILITPLSMPDNAASSTNFSIYVFVFTSGDTQNLQLGNTVLCMTNTSGQVRSRIEQSAASTVLRMNTIGFIDELGA